LDPRGQFLVVANQKSASLVVFRVDPASGTLQPAGHAVKVGTPVCVLFAS
jgi:6-phosphogluconolactonase